MHPDAVARNRKLLMVGVYDSLFHTYYPATQGGGHRVSIKIRGGTDVKHSITVGTTIVVVVIINIIIIFLNVFHYYIALLDYYLVTCF